MRVGKTYKHMNGRDVAMRVKKAIRRDDGWSIMAQWINVVNTKKHFIMTNEFGAQIIEMVFVPDVQLSNWREFDALI